MVSQIMFRGTPPESQFSSLSPFSSFCFTPLSCTDTTAGYGNETKTLWHSAWRPRPLGRAKPSHRLCEQNTLTRHIFSCFSTLLKVSHVTLAQGVVRVMSSMCHARVCLDLSSTLHFALFTVSLIFDFILLIFLFIFHVGRFGEKYPVRFRE